MFSRPINIILLLVSASISGKSQTIHFTNDSLFINNTYVNGFTSKASLDSLLDEKGNVKKAPGKYNMKLVQYIYKSSGLKFIKNDGDKSQLSVAVKLYKHVNPDIDHQHMPGEVFKGPLYIGKNYINDKREIDQLQQLKDCSVTFKMSNYSSNPVITVCNIHYQKRPIQVRFDSSNKMTIVFIN